MGEVFEAQDLTLGATVALKTIRRELSGKASSLARLRREVVLARRVTHPNVCRIFEFFESPEVAFLTMEFLEGETLAERPRRTGPQPPQEALGILGDVAAGLEAIHRSGIVHRDVKPGNVILVDAGARGRGAVVTDFGIALGRPAERFTEAGAGVGTPDALALLARELVLGTAGAGLTGVPARWRAPLERSLDSDPARRHASTPVTRSPTPSSGMPMSGSFCTRATRPRPSGCTSGGPATPSRGPRPSSPPLRWCTW